MSEIKVGDLVMVLRWLKCRLFGHPSSRPTGKILSGMMKQMICDRCHAEWQEPA